MAHPKRFGSNPAGGRVRLQDVARLADTSLPTASQALNGRSGVSPATSARVRDAAARLGYRPNLAARSLVRGHTDAIGVAISGGLAGNATSEEVYLQVLRGILDILGSHHTVVLTSCGPDMRSVLEGKGVEGVIVVGVNGDPQLDREYTDQIPTVWVDTHNTMHGMEAVDTDDEAGMFAATSHLLEHGHQRVGFLGLQRDHPFTRLGLQGYERALIAFDQKLDMDLVAVGPWLCTAAGGECGACRLLQTSPGMTAIAALDDYLAIGAIYAARRAGLAVPEQLAVIGMDDLSISGQLRPSLTTVRVEYRRMGQAAASRMKEMLVLDQVPQSEPRRQVIVPRLVRRRSCGCEESAAAESGAPLKVEPDDIVAHQAPLARDLQRLRPGTGLQGGGGQWPLTAEE